MPNVDGVDASTALSLNAANGVSHMPGVASTDADEMSIEFITRKSAYLSSFTVTTSTAVDTLIYSAYVYPGMSLGTTATYNTTTGSIKV